jgi:hypothetical protein
MGQDAEAIPGDRSGEDFMTTTAPHGTLIPLVTPEQKKQALEAEEAIWALDAPFIRFVSVTPLAQQRGTTFEVFVGTDGSHDDLSIMDVIRMLLDRGWPEFPAVVHSRRGRVR